MNKRLLITVGLVVVVVAIASLLAMYFGNQKTPPPQSEKKAEKYFVKATPVNYQKQVVTIKASGRVVSRRVVELVSEVQGQIIDADVTLKKGISFKEGDVLARIFKQDRVYSLHSLKSNYLNMLANSLPDIKIDYADAYGRWQDFFNTIDINEPLPALPEIKNNQLKVFLASRSLLSNYYSILSQEEVLKKYTITAPFDGTFTEVMLEKGSVANPGSRIARMIRTDVLEVEVPVPAIDARYLSVGDKVTLTTEDKSNTYQGTISRKAAFIDQNTQSQSVFVDVKNDGNSTLFQGQYLLAMMKGKTLDSAMELPRNAVFDGNNAYVVIDGKLHETTLDIHKLNDKTLLFSGVDEGAMIVTEPLINAKEGTPVEIL